MENRILDDIIKLIRRYEEGKASNTERNAIETWNVQIDYTPETEHDKQQLSKYGINIWSRLAEQYGFENKKLRGKHSLISFTRIHSLLSLQKVAAVAIILLLVGGAWIISENISTKDGTQNLMTAHVYKTWNTGINERNSLILPDGTEVHLNASSQLEIIEDSFNKEKREVWLTGEAFFDVTKNPDKIFIINTGAIQTIVKGTSFNVKAYEELENNVVSVRDGRVEIVKEGQTLGLLTANKELRYKKNSNRVEIIDADWQNAAGWINGWLVLNGADEKELRLRLQQQFGVEVSVLQGALDGKTIQGAFGTKSSFKEVLDAISSIYTLRYEINKNKVILYPL